MSSSVMTDIDTERGGGDYLSTQKPRFVASKIALASSVGLITLDIQHFGCWCSDANHRDKADVNTPMDPHLENAP